MARPAASIAAIVLLACSTAPGARTGAPAGASTPGPGSWAPTSVNDPVVQFLLTSAAGDFRAHGPHGITRFRDTHVGSVTWPDGRTWRLLCGEFQIGGREWSPFATVETDPYEQWLGAQSASFCENPSVTWASMEDLSAALQARLESPR